MRLGDGARAIFTADFENLGVHCRELGEQFLVARHKLALAEILALVILIDMSLIIAIEHGVEHAGGGFWVAGFGVDGEQALYTFHLQHGFKGCAITR